MARPLHRENPEQTWRGRRARAARNRMAVTREMEAADELGGAMNSGRHEGKRRKKKKTRLACAGRVQTQ